MSTMMLKSIVPFPITAPVVSPSTTHSTTEVRFSRWNNANADEFNRQRRSQKQIEDDIRRHRRFQSAENITNLFDSDNPSSSSSTVPTTITTTAPKSNYHVDRNPRFRSIGTPSTPSSSSIPEKKSKYSKTLTENPNHRTHPAFQKLKRKPIPQHGNDQSTTLAETVRVRDDGVSFVVPEAPFEYMYSYTETPKTKPLALREPPVTPFGPETMPRPWTGRKPLPPSKKKVPEFDSFVSPPNKKGVKPVQKPGPFLPGSGPKYVWSREEVLGDPLTKEEVLEMVESCRKTKRQLNMGRDGFTHNMLENIHAHWKRRRVCKIKCKGVCTVDMDNVCQQLEDKTGGKIIYRKGGVLYLFRGRNYNYKTRPRYPMMLWKPVTPVYPKLIKQIPEGLTYEEATDMRAKGRQLTPICKLGKNGVYVRLVENVREAFEACELVRIDCQGLNGSDYRRIGAKLKDLVPCVLISFERECILVWRGRDWKSSFSAPPEDSSEKSSAAATFASEDYIDLSSTDDDEDADEDEDESVVGSLCSEDQHDDEDASELHLVSVENFSTLEDEGEMQSSKKDEVVASVIKSNTEEVAAVSSPFVNMNVIKNDGNEMISDCGQLVGGGDGNEPEISGSSSTGYVEGNGSDDGPLQPSTSRSPYFEQVESLLQQAVESGSALILDESVEDADGVYKQSVAFAMHAPPMPEFERKERKVAVAVAVQQQGKGQEVKGGGEAGVEGGEFVPAIETKVMTTKTKKKKGGFPKDYCGVADPQRSLGVDELAKLLA